ncbi:PqqD family protein [Oscillatoria sp. FACHB-1407]|uniref:PqqD family protein n=1 Tax=Oscillatoria sp. FACHB-1407 TaxID=2692847 RepID=UPI0016891751|nr:PqqD family protein [Oscillatoria sp. FACHB-1407]MBD2459419.1 PqqD family protein [Oscillatoria sp. FACHB-1407]
MTTPTFKINSPTIVQETIDGEVVIVNLAQGSYYSLLDTATDIWSGIEQGLSQPAIVNKLLQLYDVQPDVAETTVQTFLQQLQTEEIIVPDANSNGAQVEELVAQPNVVKTAFKAPVLSKYTDMEELLALDPIHDVDEMGWPNAQVDTAA